MNEQLLIKNIAEIGKLLLKNGAEIYRVEESLERMCQSYGFQDIGVFALPTYFTMSVTFQDGTSTSLTKRTLQNRTNLDAVCALNDLVRKICNETPTNDFIEQQIQAINSLHPIMPLVLLGYGLGAGGYAIFFGGGLHEGIIAGIIGFLMYFFIINHILYLLFRHIHYFFCFAARFASLASSFASLFSSFISSFVFGLSDDAFFAV